MAESYPNQVLREWGPLTDLLQKLPRKVHIGILSQEVKLTCIDVVSEFIALGTNTGLVCWYNRAKRELQKLQCDNPNSQISTIKVISTVDYMLACGTTSGTINIFQIPKIHPEGIPENLKPKKQQVERYLVSDMHRLPISALEWSKNGMKLFSGDQEGVVVLTELDFYMHICKSVEILNESYEVIQLSYYQQNLLISTTYRSIICRKLEKWKITQVGKKGRKIFGNYGGVIHSDALRPNNCIVYCTRPGLRIWISDMEGNVQKTILFKDALKKQDVYMTNMNASVTSNLDEDLSFGTLATFNENFLVTFCSKVLYVLDPQKMAVLRKFYSSRGILDVATNKEEIFILEENRNLVRLGYGPELVYQEPHFGLPVNVFPASMNILGLTLDGCSITPGISEYNGLNGLSNPTGLNTEEAIECTGEENCFEDTDLKVQSKSSAETVNSTYSKIAQEDYDDNIIYKHHRYSKSHSKNGMSRNGYFHKSCQDMSKSMFCSGNVPMLPDLRSPESIKNDIESKEKIISEILNFDKIKISMLQSNQDKQVNKGHKGKDGAAKDTVDGIPNAEVLNCDGLNLVKSLEKNNGMSEESEKKAENPFEIPILSQNCTSFIKCPEVKIEKANRDYNDHSDATVSNVIPTTTIPIDIPQMQHDAEVIPSIPDVKTIPSEWNLSCVELNQQENTISESDNSLNDWEII